jgi:hypothetical protein
MQNILKFIQALGIAVCGVGLAIGISDNSIGKELLYAAIGILIFSIARYAETHSAK